MFKKKTVDRSSQVFYTNTKEPQTLKLPRLWHLDADALSPYGYKHELRALNSYQNRTIRDIKTEPKRRPPTYLSRSGWFGPFDHTIWSFMAVGCASISALGQLSLRMLLWASNRLVVVNWAKNTIQSPCTWAVLDRTDSSAGQILYIARRRRFRLASPTGWH